MRPFPRSPSPSPFQTRRASIVLAAGVLSLSAGLAGCVADRRPTPQQPDAVQATRLWIAATPPEDTDGDALPDTTLVTAFLFADPTQYQIPVQIPGAFAFQLVDEQGQTVSQWRFDAAESKAAGRNLPPGPGHVFTLSLLTQGVEQARPRTLELTGVFTPTSGRPLHSRAGASFVFGRRAR